MTALWLSRIALKRDAPVAALARLLVPEGRGDQAAAAHQLVWALFSDGPERRRDFLWRQDQPGRFLTLSARPPNPLHELFAIEQKPFEPALEAGDRLRFRLHANPVVAQPLGADRRGKRQDVVMHALHCVPKGERAPVRFQTATEAGRAWLARQGAAHGFAPVGEVGVDGYGTLRIPREDEKSRRPGSRSKPPAPIRFGVLDFDGTLKVTDPARFLAALPQGFGRAKAFGCGLMLIRRAPSEG